MGDLFKKNWKKLTGVRVDAVPLSQLELARLIDIVSTGIVGTGIVALSGDLGGNSNTAIVQGLQTVPIDPGAPASGEVLTFNGTTWIPTALATPPVVTSVGSEFRVDLPANASLAGKIAGATLPAGWSIVLGNDGSVDAEITATANDIALIHTESSFAVLIQIIELHTSGPTALDGYTIVEASAVPVISKSNQAGTQFTVLGFTGLITLTDQQRLFIKMLPTP